MTSRLSVHERVTHMVAMQGPRKISLTMNFNGTPLPLERHRTARPCFSRQHLAVVRGFFLRGGRASVLFVTGPGQINPEDCPIGPVGADLKFSAMRLDNDLANGQSNAASGSLGREKRFEDAVAILVRYP